MNEREDTTSTKKTTTMANRKRAGLPRCQEGPFFVFFTTTVTVYSSLSPSSPPQTRTTRAKPHQAPETTETGRNGMRGLRGNSLYPLIVLFRPFIGKNAHFITLFSLFEFFTCLLFVVLRDSRFFSNCQSSIPIFKVSVVPSVKADHVVVCSSEPCLAVFKPPRTCSSSRW
jgi:hypothetical protein